MYISFLAVDEKRAKALLEVFDKVCPRSVYYSVKCFSRLLCDTGFYGPGTWSEDIQKVSLALWSNGFAPRFPYHTRKFRPAEHSVARGAFGDF